MTEAERLFEDSLKLVQSQSVREWATKPHNRAIFLQISEGWARKGTSPDIAAALIVAWAMGL